MGPFQAESKEFVPPEGFYEAATFPGCPIERDHALGLHFQALRLGMTTSDVLVNPPPPRTYIYPDNKADEDV